MTANQELAGFLKKYHPTMIASAKKALAKMRKLVPGATEMVYDNYNALVIGFGPSEKASLAVFSLALLPDHISLCFLQGAGLPDPGKRLLGSGNVARHVKLLPLSVLDEKEILKLITVAMNRAKEPFDPKQKRKMVIKSISKKQRPRRLAK
jgi:hypothetical protein